MTVTRTPAQHGRRTSFREPSKLDLRLLPPLTRKAMQTVRGLGTLTLVSGRELWLVATGSSIGTALFVLGLVALFRR